MDTRDSPLNAIPLTAAILGYGGVLPFAGTALASLFGFQPPGEFSLAFIFIAYAAVILSFLGGVRWAVGMRATSKAKRRILLIASVVPSLIGWVCLFLPSGFAIAILAISFAVAGMWDTWDSDHPVLAPWYIRLRVRLTIAVVLCHLAFMLSFSGAP